MDVDEASRLSFWIVSVQGDPTPEESLRKVMSNCQELSAINPFPVPPELKVSVDSARKLFLLFTFGLVT